MITFKARNVLDFSAGWGDRLAGFYTGETTEHYVGIDPNTLNHPNYQKQIQFYEKYSTFFEQDRKADLIESPAEGEITPNMKITLIRCLQVHLILIQKSIRKMIRNRGCDTKR